MNYIIRSRNNRNCVSYCDLSVMTSVSLNKSTNEKKRNLAATLAGKNIGFRDPIRKPDSDLPYYDLRETNLLVINDDCRKRL